VIQGSASIGAPPYRPTVLSFLPLTDAAAATRPLLPP
jgi:hypothetical protein